MSPVNSEPITTCHVVALPYPGRGHINPMMNLCNLLSSRCHLISISFVVTEEWLGLIGSEQRPDNIRFVTIPNVLPSERVRAADMLGFINATLTKMEEPFEQLLDRLVVPPTVILADVFVSWVVDVGKRRNIPAALLWPMPASVFSIFYHFDLLVQNGQFPTDLTDRGDELVDYIPGFSPIKISDLPSIIHDNDQLVQNVFKVLSNVPKAQYLLFTSIFELEAPVFESLKPKFPFPLYSVGPLIPYLNNKNTTTSTNNYPDYLKWLDSQAQSSVLYVSLGSFLSTSGSQMDEIISGLCNSGVRFLLVARDKALTVKVVSREIGMVLPWCDQLRVLCHPSIGGFWTHCGWSSTMESVYAGVPMIGFPLFMDQPTVSKIISKDWKIGWKLKGGEWGSESLVKRDEVAKLVGTFMDPENNERKELAMRARQIQEICRGAIQDGGSSDHNLGSFIRNIFK